MSEIATRPIIADDLVSILAVQQACYNEEFLEPGDAPASRQARSPAVCLVALHRADVAGYLLSYAWHAWTPPKLHVPLSAPDAVDMLWFVYDIAITPTGRGQRLGEQLYAMASASAHAQGLRQFRLVTARGMDVFQWRLGYQPADVDSVVLTALRVACGEDVGLMGCALP